MNVSSLPSTRADAIAAGVRLFFTGKPCLRGHVAARGLPSGNCSECAKIATRAYNLRSYHENPEKWRERRRGYYQADPERYRQSVYKSRQKHADQVKTAAKARYLKKKAEDPASIRARLNKWCNENPEKRKAAAARYRIRNADRIKERRRQYYLKNRDQIREAYKAWAKGDGKLIRNAHEQNRRALKRASSGAGISATDIANLTERQRGRCALCGRKRVLTVDHITPIARGGQHEPRNVQMLCKSCNSSKGARDPIEHSQRLGLLL